MQMIKLLEQYHIECNLLCVVTKRLAKKAERVYKSMKATGVRYLQFIPCLDPLGAQRGIENYSLSPELYAQFLCALFDAWYRDWKTGVYVSVRLFEDYIQLLMGAPTGTCSTTGACGSYMVVEGSGAVYPCDFYCLDEYKLGTIQNDSLQSLLLGEKMRIFIKDGRNVPAECQQCRWVNLCHGGCKPNTPLDHRAQVVAQVQQYIRAHLAEKLTLNDVAAVFNFSPNYLSQLFAQNSERGFVEYVTTARIAAAKELMAATDLKIYEVSSRVGFDSAFYFSKVFKKLEGASPREYIQRMKGSYVDAKDDAAL